MRRRRVLYTAQPAIAPSTCLRVDRAFDSTAPDLPTRIGIVIHQADNRAALSRSSGGGDTGRARAHDQDIEFLARIASQFVTHGITSIPDSHRIWQVRQCDIPLIVMRHSKQIPIPHSGPRVFRSRRCGKLLPPAWPQRPPLCPAPLQPTPLTFSATRLGMNVFLWPLEGR